MNRVVLLASLALSLTLAAVVHAQDKKPDDKGKPEPKTIIIQIDASKLPPDVLKRLMELSSNPKGEPKSEDKKPEPKPAQKPVKAISLSEAIAIAEKVAQGTAVEAGREDEEGEVSFEVVVVGKDGRKQTVELDASGKVRPSEGKKPDEKKGEEKKPDEKKGEEKKPVKKEKDD